MQKTNFEKSNRNTKIVLAVVTALSLILATTIMVNFNSGARTSGIESTVVNHFVKGTTDEPVSFDHPVFPATYGKDADTHTLVLYDDNGDQSELQAILAGNLATHFGMVTLQQVSDYRAGQLKDFDALIYQGLDAHQVFPDALISDIRDGDTKVLWAHANLNKIAGKPGSSELVEFVSTYGFDPNQLRANTTDRVTSIDYHAQELRRNENSRPILVSAEAMSDKVEILGSALCGSVAQPKDCAGHQGTSFPWAFRSENITYVGDLPFEWHEQGSHYLAFADLYFDLLAPDTVQTHKAAVRIEDVSPMSDPRDLRRVADVLSSRGIPFHVAVIPFYVAETETNGDNKHIGLALKDKPEVVKALKYMQEKGGVLIQHGTTHQYGWMQNPYPGAKSAADYEFVRARCSKENEQPWEFEVCKQDSWVQLTGPVAADHISDHSSRVAEGKSAFTDAGLDAPDIFEVPHYAASPNAYVGIGEHYNYRYEQTEYFAGLITGRHRDFHASLTQILPYSVTDVYGTQVFPENLGNPSLEMLNNHAARPPALLVDNARKNLAVRESTASFFFHPFLDTAILEDIADGIERLGYSFVAAYEL